MPADAVGAAAPDEGRAARVTPPGLPASLDYPEVPVGAVLLGAAARWPDRVGWIDPAPEGTGRELTFADAARRAAQFANALLARGIGRGDVVAVHAPNCIDYPSVYYGILMAGATFSPTNPLLPPDDLVAQLNDCAAKAVVTWGIAAPAIAGVRDRVPAQLVVGVGTDAAGTTGSVDVELEAFITGQPDTAPTVDIDVHRDLAHLAYTGGTTGRSKGVELPHRNVIVNALQYACWGSGSVPRLDAAGNVVLDQIGAEQEWPARLGTGIAINLTPWFHAMGTIGGLNIALLSGTTLVLHLRFDPSRYLADAERFRVTSMGGAPPIYVALLQHADIGKRDLSTVTSISSGAAPLPIEVLEALKQRFPQAKVGEGYGLTEVTMGATSNPSWRSGVRKVGTVGVPVFDTDVKLVDGEVCIRGPQVMRGYHHRPEATAEVLNDGWLRTGDVGSIDEDGYLTIVDRKKDMLIYKGYNVYPRELEEVLFQHPSIANAAVVGKRDLAAGELPVAFVVLSDPDAEPQEVMAWVNERVTPYKKLRDIRVVDEIPVSAAGKILRRELRDRIEHEG